MRFTGVVFDVLADLPNVRDEILRAKISSQSPEILPAEAGKFPG